MKRTVINNLISNKIAYMLIISLFCIFVPIFFAYSQTFSIGYQKYVHGDFQGAEIAFKKALQNTKSTQEKAQIYKYIAITQYMQNKKEQAMANFKNAINLYPSITILQNEVLDENIIDVFNKLKQAHYSTKQSLNKTSSTNKQSATKKIKSTVLKVNCNINASVLIDGILAGSTNTFIDVNPGLLEFEISAPGYITKKIKTNIIPNTENILNINLEKVPPPKPKISQNIKDIQKQKPSSQQKTLSSNQTYQSNNVSPKSQSSPQQQIFLPAPGGKELFKDDSLSQSSPTFQGRDLAKEFESDIHTTQPNQSYTQPTPNPYTLPYQPQYYSPTPPPPPTYSPYYAPYTPAQPYYMVPAPYTQQYGYYYSPQPQPPSYAVPSYPQQYQQTPIPSQSYTQNTLPPSIDDSLQQGSTNNKSDVVSTTQPSASTVQNNTQPSIDYYFEDTSTKNTNLNKKNIVSPSYSNKKSTISTTTKKNLYSKKNTGYQSKSKPKIYSAKNSNSRSTASILFSLLPFGAGQYYHGKFILGGLFTISQVAMLYLAYDADIKIKDAVRQYNESPDDDQQFREDAQKYIDKTTLAKNVYLASFVTLWSLSSLESLIFGSKSMFAYDNNIDTNYLYASQYTILADTDESTKLAPNLSSKNNSYNKTGSLKFGYLLNLNKNNIDLVPALKLNIEF